MSVAVDPGILLRFASFQQPDTTEAEPFEFPEEENKHLVRDITVFVIIASFAAFFLIKVFLEGDEEEEPPDGPPGKPPPGG